MRHLSALVLSCTPLALAEISPEQSRAQQYLDASCRNASQFAAKARLLALGKINADEAALTITQLASQLKELHEQKLSPTEEAYIHALLKEEKVQKVITRIHQSVHSILEGLQAKQFLQSKALREACTRYKAMLEQLERRFKGFKQP